MVTATASAARGGVADTRRAWGLTALLMGLYLVNWADKAVLGIVAQPLAEEVGLSAAQLGLVGSAFFAAFTITGPLAGVLHRLASLRWLLALCALAWAVAMLPMLVWASFGVLLASRVLLGAAEGPSSALIYTAVYSWHPPQRRGLPSACITGAASLAKIVVAPLLAVLVAACGWRAAFLVLAVVGVAWVLVWWAAWSPGPHGGGGVRAGDAEPGVPWRVVFTRPTFLAGSAVVFAMYAVVSVVLTWLPSYVEKGLGFSRVQAGLLFAVPSVLSLIVSLLISAVGDRALRRGASSRLVRGVVPACGVLLCGVAFAAVPFLGTGSPWVVVAVVSVGYGFGPSVFPLLNAAVSEVVPARQTAGALGVFLAVMSAGGIVGPYATGLIVDAAPTPTLGYAWAFAVFGVVAAVGAVAALIWVDPERDRLA